MANHRRIPGQVLPGTNPELRAALQLIKDGATDQGVTEVMRALHVQWGIPVADTVVHQFTTPFIIKREP